MRPLARPSSPAQLTASHSNALAPPCIAIEDWDALFLAVKTRLTLIGQPQDTPEAHTPYAELLQQTRASVLECVEALDQLHVIARDELAKRHR